VSFVTDFADLGVMLPLILMVALALAAGRWRRGAVAWLLAVAATLAVALVAKLAAFAWPHALLVAAGLRSPSGHTAAAAVVYGGLLALLAPRCWTRPWAAFLAAALVACVIGGTRLALHVHTPVEVLVGAATGIAGAVVLAQLAGERPLWMQRALPVTAVVVTIMLFHGTHLKLESEIQRFAQVLRPPAVMPDRQTEEHFSTFPPLRAEIPFSGTSSLR
jgi:membrane-associated phospholipid phosphatase